MKLVGYNHLGYADKEGDCIYVTSSILSGSSFRTECDNTFFNSSNGTSIMIVGWDSKSNGTYYRISNYTNQPGTSIGSYSIAYASLGVNNIEPPYYITFVGNTRMLRCRGLVIDDEMVFKCTTTDELHKSYIFDLCSIDSSNNVITANPFYNKLRITKNFKAIFTAVKSYDSVVSPNGSAIGDLGVLIFKEDKDGE